MSRAVLLVASLALSGAAVCVLAACAHGDSEDAVSVEKTKSTAQPSSAADDDDSAGDDDSTGDGPIKTPKGDGGSSSTGDKDSGTTEPPGKDCGKVLINEIQADGASAADEFVELYNAGTCAQNLAGYKLRYYSATGTTATATPCFEGTSSDTIGTGQSAYFVIGGSGFSGSTDADIGCGGFSKDGARLELLDPNDNVIDGVGYGDASNTKPTEKATAPKPAKNGSVGRKTDGLDTNSNSSDFKTFSSPTPGEAN